MYHVGGSLTCVGFVQVCINTLFSRDSLPSFRAACSNSDLEQEIDTLGIVVSVLMKNPNGAHHSRLVSAQHRRRNTSDERLNCFMTRESKNDGLWHILVQLELPSETQHVCMYRNVLIETSRCI